MFAPRGPSMAMFNENITGEEVKLIREDKRPHAEIAESYGVSVDLVKNLKRKT